MEVNYDRKVYRNGIHNIHRSFLSMESPDREVPLREVPLYSLKVHNSHLWQGGLSSALLCHSETRI